jgi:hypothetical protein
MNETTMSEPKTKKREGRLATLIEDQTVKVPSDAFLWTAFIALIGAGVLSATKQRTAAQIVGQLAPVLLLLGVYNKLVKLHGHDRASENRASEESWTS